MGLFASDLLFLKQAHSIVLKETQFLPLWIQTMALPTHESQAWEGASLVCDQEVMLTIVTI